MTPEKVEKPNIQDYSGEEPEAAPEPRITENQTNYLIRIRENLGMGNEEFVRVLGEDYGVDDVAELTKYQASALIDRMKKEEERREKARRQEKRGKPTAQAGVVPKTSQGEGVVCSPARQENPAKMELAQIKEGFAVIEALKGIIEQKEMYSVIGGRKYAHVDAWVMIGALRGDYSTVKNVEVLTDGYRAEVELHDHAGRVISSGVAECRRTEKNWKTRDDYALLSMAQTRALGKAYRLRYGWIMRGAGIESTPKEEMEE